MSTEPTIKPLAMPPLSSSALLGWLRGKIADAEKTLRAREQMENAWLGGTDKSWRAVGCKLGRTQRIAMTDTHARIAKKCRREVQMFRSILDALIHPNDPDQRPPANDV